MKHYFVLDDMIFFKLKSKLFLIYFVSIGLIGVLFANISIILKGIFLLCSIFLMILNWYRLKYIWGLKKNPFEIDFDKKTFKYFNEFRGLVNVDILNIRDIIFYSRNNKPYLIEIGIKGTSSIENVNTEGLDIYSIKNMTSELIKINPNILTKEIEKSKKIRD